jgi:hypothetical protein
MWGISRLLRLYDLMWEICIKVKAIWSVCKSNLPAGTGNPVSIYICDVLCVVKSRSWGFIYK